MTNPAPKFVLQIQPQPVPEQWLFTGELRNGIPTVHVRIFGVSGVHESFMQPEIAITLLEDGLNIAREVGGKLWTPTSGNGLSGLQL
jgi:hypothetical protein